MNIQPNYSHQQVINRAKSNNVNSNRSYSTQVVSDSQSRGSSDVNFNGLGRYLQKGRVAMRKCIPLVMDKELESCLLDYSGILDVPLQELKKLVKGKTARYFDFLDAMATKYNGHNFAKKLEEREDPNVVMDLLKRVKSPSAEHVKFVSATSLTMTDIHKCFGLCKDDPKKLRQYGSVYKRLNETRNRDGYMREIINSPNCEEYINNIDTYMPCFDACEEMKGVVAQIDKNFEHREEKATQLFKTGCLDHLFKLFPEVGAFTRENLFEKVSTEANDMAFTLGRKFMPKAKNMEAGDAKGYYRIYTSTTKENHQFRTDFIESNYQYYMQRENFGENELNDLALILDYADQNPHAKKFLQAIADKTTNLCGAAGYIELFDKVGAERLAQDTDSVLKVIRNNRYTPVEAVLKHYEEVDSKPKSFMTIIRDMFRKEIAPQPKDFSLRAKLKGDTMEPVRKVEDITAYQPKAPVSSATSVSIGETPLNTSAVDEVVSTSIAGLEKPKARKRSYIFTPHVPKAPSAKKLAVINDVDNVIKKTLGAKVYEEQKAIYANNATKMRLGMLDEIFASIKDTRAQERAAGTFSKHKSVSNEEAVDLYRRINGKNKKLVNYMLKQRKEDGTRQFSVRDILDTLADANRSILKGKAKSNRFNRFTAQDERNIYDSIFADKFEAFGKLRRQPKKSKVNQNRVSIYSNNNQVPAQSIQIARVQLQPTVSVGS